jgi:hypothetical protein
MGGKPVSDQRSELRRTLKSLRIIDLFKLDLLVQDEGGRESRLSQND